MCRFVHMAIKMATFPSRNQCVPGIEEDGTKALTSEVKFCMAIASNGHT